MDNLNEKIENEVLEVAEELPEEVANEEKEMKEENKENFFQKN